MKCYTPQIIDAELIRVMIEEVQAAPAHGRLGVVQSPQYRREASAARRYQSVTRRPPDVPVAGSEEQHLLFKVILARHTSPV